MLLFLVGVVIGVCVVSVLRHKSKNPEKSYMIAILNTALFPMRFFRLGQFKHGRPDLETMMKAVEKETRLDDFGDESFVNSYRVINRQKEFKAQRYTTVGAMLATTELRMSLTRRLKMVRFLKINPSVELVPIKAPVFVFGLGRSGTTFLHRLLSLDPKVRSPRLWELVTPVPDLSLHQGSSAAELAADRAARKETIRARIAERHSLGDDGLEKFHEIGHDLAEEDLLAMSDELPIIFHYMSYTITHWDSLTEQLQEKDFVRAYTWYKKVLQLLSWQAGEDEKQLRWVLKCPVHIFMLPYLAKAFPDAKLVWAHRHPVPTISSLCSLITAMRGIYFDAEQLDRAQLGQTFLSLGAKLLEQTPKIIESTGLPCAHVLFEKLVADPIAQVKEVYRQFDLEFTPEYEEILQQYLVENAKQRESTKEKLSKPGEKKTKLHDHKPEDFFIPSQELCSGVFADYIKTFGITSAK